MADARWYKGMDDAIAALGSFGSWYFGEDARADALDELKELRERGPEARPEPTWEEAWANEAAIREQLPAGSWWRHKKRGTDYEVFNIALFQDATGSGEHDMALVVFYWSFARKAWCVRPVAEFLDGRFERIER